MKEKFSDYEGKMYLSSEGDFNFEITNAELVDSKKGEPMWKFDVEAPEGISTIYHSLNPKARWSFNNLIKACLKLNTREKIEAFECDYETIGQDLVGKHFIGTVEADSYTKEVKKPMDDGTFETSMEERVSYKIKSYKEA